MIVTDGTGGECGLIARALGGVTKRHRTVERRAEAALQQLDRLGPDTAAGYSEGSEQIVIRFSLTLDLHKSG